MSLEWTHAARTCPAGADCARTTNCACFPTVPDRVAMAQAAFDAYAEADGTSLDDFLADIALLVLTQHYERELAGVSIIGARCVVWFVAVLP